MTRAERESRENSVESKQQHIAEEHGSRGRGEDGGTGCDGRGESQAEK